MFKKDTIPSKPIKHSWKWEINHDGPILSYEGPNHPNLINRLVPTSIPVQKTLIDYWYIVHDGVVIPTGDY